ncbi:hypothetical protein [Limimaricola hongkongensis]|uniref:hypothetical protein n=1 Tax=Limimaricola hongkongensis TaxID=278132 RepID=UPI00037C4404|nr:hypothetical protein [Limimaricola hongkongensis]
MTKAWLLPQDTPDPDEFEDLSFFREPRKAPRADNQPLHRSAALHEKTLELLAHRDVRIAELVAALERERLAHQETRQEVAPRIEEIAQLTLRTYENETELQAVRTQLDEATTERDTLRAKCDELQAERDALRTSTSWKLTAPVRWVRLRFQTHQD